MLCLCQSQTVSTSPSSNFNTHIYTHTNTASHTATVLVNVLFHPLGLGAPQWGARALGFQGSWGQGSSLHQPLVPQRLPLE